MKKIDLSAMEFQLPFRKYQNMILNQVEALKTKQSKFHIVAPPGSGKTIVGLELIKRFNMPAVVFAPTSTIQFQWKEKVKLFLSPKDQAALDKIASIKPDNIRLINIYTYQLISSPAENLSFAEESAVFEWKDSLVAGGAVANIDEASQRVAALKKSNSAAYQKELAKYYKRIKDAYLRDPNFDGTQFLHENAKKLIDDLVRGGVKIIVMDEVHHLLDYWALVIRELIKRIGDPILIGLTATPPLSAAQDEMENYLSIMKDIDFEIPTPAVVKEGNLAPYQDLVYFCTPTKKEKEFIDSLEERFESVIKKISEKELFKAWVKKRVIERPIGDGKRQDWTQFFNSHPFLAVAGIKYIEQILNENLPFDIIETEETEESMNIDDWVYLLMDYSLNFLKLSDQKEYQEELRAITAMFRSFGYVLTENGVRKLRSPSDKILALSEAKNNALLKILTTEMDSLGDKLRVVVITDFEKQSATSVKGLSDILDEESGGAVRAFKYIVNDPVATKLEPILVTGTTVLVDVDNLKPIMGCMERWKDNNGLKFKFEAKKTQYEKIMEITGSGPDWKSNTYVRMCTALFDKGIIKCLVGTRGLLGEGWDSLTLNTLIDLTQAATNTTVNQIRGRSIRLDPAWPEKVSNNWDIVCIDPSFEKGNQDFERFLEKHRQFYGLGTKSKIVKGFLHVDEKLGLEYHTIGFKRIIYHLVNMRMLNKARDRVRVYKDWKIGEAYSNFEYAATKLDAADLKFQTVYTLKDSLRAIFNNIFLSFVSFTVWYFYIFGNMLDYSITSKPLLFFLSIIFLFGVFAFTGKNIKKYITKGFVEVPLDSFVLDMGKALLKSLREAGLVESSQSIDNVRVVNDEFSYYDLYLDYAARKDAQLFSNCFKEMLSPVTNQRYLVSRSTDNIKIGFYSPVWWALRKIFRLIKQEKIAYHGVPGILSANRKFTDIFAKNWQEYVGGGDIIYTRSERGSQLLLKIRRENRHKIKKLAYEIWK